MVILSSFGIKDLIDILIITSILYGVCKRMILSGVFVILAGIIAYVVLWGLVSFVFNFSLTGFVFDGVSKLGGFILVVLFHDEIRKYFTEIGRYYWRTFEKIASIRKKKEISEEGVNAIIRACLSMSKSRTGALIAVEKRITLANIIKSAEPIHAQLSGLLIESLFFKNSALHDGAVHVKENEIVSAGGYLPFTKRTDVPQRFGTRHRSALGLSEVCDARVIVVSEETRAISVACGGKLFHNLTSQQLEEMLLAEEVDLKKGI
ncbi:MAG TPA: TIGR00159 family protein [Porphyromonadaceae bacterium]|nr:TIGR00159 family protein [Porphyromonadaceae bacterium]